MVLLSLSRSAEAQYKNNQLGFETGYSYLGSAIGIEEHHASFGLRYAYKISDHWWLSWRSHISFRGEQGTDRTVILWHTVPVDARYYFLTDAFRPFAGVTNSIQLLFNQTVEQTVFWGPGVTAGAEFKLRRDLFLGIQADAYWMLVFQGEDVPLITATAQLLFFL